MRDDENVLRAIFQKDAIHLDRDVGHGRLVTLYAFGLVLGCFPWVMEASGLARAESRRFVFERFVGAEWALSGILIPFVAAKLMRRERGVKPTVARILLPRLLWIVLFATELLLVSAPLCSLLHEMGVGSGREWIGTQLELLSFLVMLAAIAMLLHLVLEHSLAAFGATYAAAAALVWIGGGFQVWLALGAASVALLALRSHRSLLYAE